MYKLSRNQLKMIITEIFMKICSIKLCREKCALCFQISITLATMIQSNKIMSIAI